MGKFAQNAAGALLVGTLMTGFSSAYASDSDEVTQYPKIPDEVLVQVDAIMDDCIEGAITPDDASDRIYDLMEPLYLAADPEMDILARAAARQDVTREVHLQCGRGDEDAESQRDFRSPLEM